MNTGKREKESRKRQEDAMPVTDRFGPCPQCGMEDSKIIEGKAGEYFKMVCIDGHFWTHRFPKPKPVKSNERDRLEAGLELVVLARDAVIQASYFVGDVRKCDLCKGTAHREACALGKIEKLLGERGISVEFDGVRKEEISVIDGEGGRS